MRSLPFFLILLIALFCGAPTRAATVELSVEKQKEIITLTLPSASPRKIFTLSGPDRLVIDVPALPGRTAAGMPASYRGGLIRGVRLGRFTPETSRFVFDLARKVRVAAVREANARDGDRLIIEIVPADQAAEAPPPKPLVVIDAGHGGADPGATGRKGTQEKYLVFEYAKTLKERLLRSGRYRVLLTRDDDRYIMLRHRIAIARKAGAALFISLHADSAPSKEARGLSVYTVSEQASDAEAAALAAQENKSDIIAGMDLSEERRDVADILISLAQRETNNRSATLADLLVTELDGRVTLLPNPHRFAGFAVLKAPDIPSVLVEVGFLSHPSEEKLLKSQSHREKVATGILAGIDAYFRQLQEAGSE